MAVPPVEPQGLDNPPQVYTSFVIADELWGPPVTGCIRTVPARLYANPPRHVVPYYYLVQWLFLQTDGQFFQAKAEVGA